MNSHNCGAQNACLQLMLFINLQDKKKDQASYKLDLLHNLLFETNLSHNVLVFVLELYDTI